MGCISRSVSYLRHKEISGALFPTDGQLYEGQSDSETGKSLYCMQVRHVLIEICHSLTIAGPNESWTAQPG